MTRRPDAPLRVAIVRLSALGDVILALPALEALRAAAPDAEITWITEAASASLLEGHPALDRIIVFPKEDTRRLLGPWSQIPSAAVRLLRFFRSLRHHRFDLVFDLQGNVKSGVVTFWTRAKRRYGLPSSHTREPNRWATHDAPTLDERPVHISDLSLAVIAEAGFPVSWRSARLGIRAKDRAAAMAAIEGIAGMGPLILLQPGTSARMPHKRWPIARWQDLAQRLVEDFDARVIVHVGPGDDGAREIAWAVPRVRLVERLDGLLSLAALLELADLVVGPDTGPTHLAEVLGRPVVTILGPTDPRAYYPYGHPERAVFRRIGCAPCRHRGCILRTCMDAVSVNEVLQTIDRALPARVR